MAKSVIPIESQTGKPEKMENLTRIYTFSLPLPLKDTLMG